MHLITANISTSMGLYHAAIKCHRHKFIAVKADVEPATNIMPGAYIGGRAITKKSASAKVFI